MKNYKSEVDYKNDFNRKNYDHINLMLPKGKKEEWKAEAKRRNLSLNAMVQTAVTQYLHSNCTTCNICDCEKSKKSDE